MIGAPASVCAPRPRARARSGASARMAGLSTVRARTPAALWSARRDPLAPSARAPARRARAPPRPRRTLDVHWEAPSGALLARPRSTALVSVALGFLAGEAARRLGDARLFLVSLAFITSAGFLGLHALATPGVLLEKQERRLRRRDPGRARCIAGVFAAASRARPLARRVGGRHEAPVAPARTRLRRCSAPGPSTRSRTCRRSTARSRPRRRTGRSTRSPRRPAALRVRRLALPGASTGGGRPRCRWRRRRLHPARRGDDRDRLRSQLARLVVGVARADGARVRDRRRSPPASSTGAAARPPPSSRTSTSSTRPSSSTSATRRRSSRARRLGEDARTRAAVQRGRGAAPRAGRRGAPAARRALQPYLSPQLAGPAPRRSRRRPRSAASSAR